MTQTILEKGEPLRLQTVLSLCYVFYVTGTKNLFRCIYSDSKFMTLLSNSFVFSIFFRVHEALQKLIGISEAKGHYYERKESRAESHPSWAEYNRLGNVPFLNRYLMA